MFAALLTAISIPILAAASPSCADPVIASAVATTLGNNGAIASYDVAITVRNAGTVAEPSSMLQSVEVYQDATKVDQIGTPPLRPGQSATVHYRLKRSFEARPGSTHLRLQLVLRDPHGMPFAVCSGANGAYRLNL
jgi:hypothetical protein